MNPTLEVVDTGKAFRRVGLTEPSQSGYVLLAAEVDRRPPFLWPSATKRSLIRDCKELYARLIREDKTVSATVFRAMLIPPGRGRFLERRSSQVHIARFDIAVLIETENIAAAQQLRADDAFVELETRVRQTARYTHVITATNVKRIGPVDHRRDGIFLFNYFFADDTAQNLAVWEYTAGWFQQETGLDNSTVLLPVDESGSQYNLINHCRWDHLWDILPSLLFKTSFRSYVLANFEANHVAAMPVLYRRA